MTNQIVTTFLYFAYGSNLLAQRIHINNPTAVRVGIGKLKNYQLDFKTYSARWRGAAATIIEQPDKEVWGAIWRLDQKDMEHLDRQEGVHSNIYFPLEVDVEMPEGQNKKCRVYQQTGSTNATKDWAKLEQDRRPSAVYLQTIIKGANESDLPLYYQEFLKKIPHNGYDGTIDLQLDLEITH